MNDSVNITNAQARLTSRLSELLDMSKLVELAEQARTAQQTQSTPPPALPEQQRAQLPQLEAPLSGFSLDNLMKALGNEERRLACKQGVASLQSKAAEQKSKNDEILHKMQENLDRIEKQKKLSWFLKVFQVIGTIFACAVAAVSIATGVGTAAGVLLLALAASSIADLASDGKYGISGLVSKTLTALGVPENVAKWIGMGVELALTVLSVVLTFGGTAGSAASKISKVAETAAKVASEATEVGSQVTSAAAKVTSATAKVAELTAVKTAEAVAANTAKAAEKAAAEAVKKAAQAVLKAGTKAAKETAEAALKLAEKTAKEAAAVTAKAAKTAAASSKAVEAAEETLKNATTALKTVAEQAASVAQKTAEVANTLKTLKGIGQQGMKSYAEAAKAVENAAGALKNTQNAASAAEKFVTAAKALNTAGQGIQPRFIDFVVKVVARACGGAQGASSLGSASVGIALAKNTWDNAKGQADIKDLQAILERLRTSMDMEKELIKAELERANALMGKAKDILDNCNQTQARILSATPHLA